MSTRSSKARNQAIFQPTRYELVVNAKVARTLGLTLSNSTALLRIIFIEMGVPRSFDLDQAAKHEPA